MVDNSSLLRLMSWLSPVFPTGGFSYSSGLEAAVHSGLVTNEDHLQKWLSTALLNGALRNDAIFLAAAWINHDVPDELDNIGELALALAGSESRYLEMTAQGDAFAQAVKSWPETADIYLPSPCTLNVAIGAAAGHASIELDAALSGFLHSAVTNQVQASIRLSVMGQTGATRIMAAMETDILNLTSFAVQGDLADLGSAAFNADIMAMKHGHLESRMFRS